ncbi:hypothetical protein AJ80_06981 [Polytolypa hystricis UAMH7299]|uniref:Uncharacterized protein n=1 Tax=Polytolypa hystricis (strain UAMH7299) TaxID=1447883 RepID=A0A2B7XST8_POLH7|nr:hypothetical protein AJ80_06981 [Polytolypa hystricis UAMH7299]
MMREQSIRSIHTAERHPQLNLSISGPRGRPCCLCSTCPCARDNSEADINPDLAGLELSEASELDLSAPEMEELTTASSPTSESDIDMQEPYLFHLLPRDSDSENMELSIILTPLRLPSPFFEAERQFGPWIDITLYRIGNDRNENDSRRSSFALIDSPPIRPSSPTDSMFNNADSSSGGESMTSSVASSRLGWSGTASFYTRFTGGGTWLELTEARRTPCA